MFSQLRMREEQALLAQDYALEQARRKGRAGWNGLERGKLAAGRREKLFAFLDMARQHVLNFRICK